MITRPTKESRKAYAANKGKQKAYAAQQRKAYAAQRKAYAVHREKHTRLTKVSRKHRRQGRNKGKAITTKPRQTKGTNRNPTNSRKCSILLDHGNGDDGHTDDPQAGCGNDGSERSVTSDS